MVILWIVGVTLLAVLASYTLVGLAARHGGSLGMVDVPRAGEVQVRPVPRNGGYGMLVAIWLATGLAVFARPAELQAAPGDDWKLIGVLLGSLLIVPLAMLDDKKRLGAGAQLVGQLAIAAVPVAFGLRIDSIASPFGSAVELPVWLGMLLTVLWIVGMINAINLIDVMDGLAGGIALMGAGVLFVRSLLFGQYTIAVLPLALAGAALGFLPHNFHPARIFMGTSGSVLLGYWLATMSVIGGAKVGTAFVVLGVPILNTAWVIGRRALAGRSPFQGGDSELLAAAAPRTRVLAAEGRPAALPDLRDVRAAGVDPPRPGRRPIPDAADDEALADAGDGRRDGSRAGHRHLLERPAAPGQRPNASRAIGRAAQGTVPLVTAS